MACPQALEMNPKQRNGRRRYPRDSSRLAKGRGPDRFKLLPNLSRQAADRPLIHGFGYAGFLLGLIAGHLILLAGNVARIFGLNFNLLYDRVWQLQSGL